MPPQKQEFFSQTDDSSLEPAGCVMQLAGKGGRGRGVHRDQCQPCLPGTRGRDGGVGMGRWRWGDGDGAGAACPRLESTAPGGTAGLTPLWAVSVSVHPAAKPCAHQEFLHAREDTLPLPEMPSLSVHTAIAPDWCWALLLKPI